MNIGADAINQCVNRIILSWKITGHYDHNRNTFLGLKEDCSFAFFRNLLKNEPIAKLDTTGRTGKSSATAQTLRTEGNNFFKNGQYGKALELYNNSLAAAPACAEDLSGKNNLALAFSNRSAALFHMDKYEECLKDITSALHNGYSQHLQHKLYARKGHCYLALKSPDLAKLAYQDAERVLENAKLDEVQKNALATEFQKSIAKCLETVGVKGVEYSTKPADRALPTFADGPNTTHPSLSSACSVTYTPNKGRKNCKVLANRDIEPGEEILVEKPYATVLSQRFLSTHCYHCLEPCVTPTVCSQCPVVRYCSEACRELSWDIYHKYECSFLFMLFELDDQMRLALRVILVSGLDCLLDKRNKDDECTSSAMSEELLGFNEDGQYLYNDYHTLHKRVGLHSWKADGDYKFQLAAYAHYVIVCLEAANFFSEVSENEREIVINYVGGVFSKLITEHGNHILHLFQKGTAKRDVIGLGLYVTFTLLNHSCDLVTSRVFYGEHIVVRSTKTIRKGEEVLTNCGVSYANSKRSHRQAFLKEHFYFECTCEACINDWIGYDFLNNNILAQFKCGNCSKPLPQTMDTIHCSNCQAVQKPAKKHSVLMKSIKSFQGAFDNIGIGLYVEALPVILKHIAVMDRLMVCPFRHYFLAQEQAQICMQNLAS